ncbi:MAG: DUF885 domain-containing protein [Bacteroidetes bacterium]|nr:DUF885 domain-containing protein [Bacteroidota bacterium]
MANNFQEFSDKAFNTFLEKDPVHASSLGLHEHDGKLSTLSIEELESVRKEFGELYNELLTFKKEELSGDQPLEFDFIKWILESYFFEHDELQSYKKNPMFYAGALGNIGQYISRDYAPFEERLQSVINLLGGVPTVFENAQKNLEHKCAALHCKYAKLFTEGYVQFFRDDLSAEINKREVSEELIDKYNTASKTAIESIEKYLRFIEETLVPNADDNFRLGEDKFQKMLSIKEHIDLPIDKIKKLGEMELHRLLNEYNELVNVKHPGLDPYVLEEDHPSAATLVEETTGTLNDLIEFIKERDIIEFPEKMNCIVTEMPKYMGFGFAAMDTAGPFEKSDESYYYVNLPEKEWDEKKTEEWMTLFNFPTLKMISIHEAFPGHYTHFLYSNKYANRFAKISMSYTYVEGWAHYTEEMMSDMGYDSFDPKMKLAQLIEALIRCCRYLVAVGLHTEKMTIEEAVQFFMKNAFMPETTARQEAERGAFDPGYLSYTLGKIYLKKLKQMFFDKHKDKELKEFHKRIVSMGCPTYRMAEKYILA